MNVSSITVLNSSKNNTQKISTKPCFIIILYDDLLLRHLKISPGTFKMVRFTRFALNRVE